ncbi:MAG TPA: ferritin-like domain-containing protein [Verrucomicrobiales bacterium]|nr:ferritin-like domain-containing protein [Verrucomicrobiales bacterium]
MERPPSSTTVLSPPLSIPHPSPAPPGPPHPEIHPDPDSRARSRLSSTSHDSTKHIFGKWIAHFHANRLHRPEPDWEAPTGLSSVQIQSLLPSLEQFELGDGGGPACLIAFNAERFRSKTETTRQVVDLWFNEEREHARLLGCAVDRFGGRHIAGHWSFSAFYLCRRWLGVRFEVQALLLTEIVSDAYYRVLRAQVPDRPLQEMCSLIIRDEAGHIAFHLDRVVAGQQRWPGWLRAFWRLQFRVLGHVAAAVLWTSHGPCLRPLGVTTPAYFRAVRQGIESFLRRCRRCRSQSQW